MLRRLQPKPQRTRPLSFRNENKRQNKQIKKEEKRALKLGSFCRGPLCLTQRENEMSELGMNRLMCIYNMNSSKNEKILRYMIDFYHRITLGIFFFRRKQWRLKRFFITYFVSQFRIEILDRVQRRFACRSIHVS